VTEQPVPTIAIVGPGAIGTTVAAALHAEGRTPALYGRSARDDLRLQVAERLIVVPGPVLVDPAQPVPSVDLVFLAVKATQIDGAAPWLHALCHPGTVVCVLQNGVEQVADVAPHVSQATVAPSVVWFPAQAQSNGSVWLRGDARLTVPRSAAGRLVAEALEGTLVTVDQVDDFTSAAWRKLLQNAAAGLMVLTGRRAGMFARPDVASLTLAYLREGLLVARAAGAALGSEVPQQILDTFQRYPADMGTSILADREADRALEWNIRNGVIQRLGRVHGIATPIGDIVVPLLAAGSDGPG
jgi:2-dehydropantoate 2-reductase